MLFREMGNFLKCFGRVVVNVNDDKQKQMEDSENKDLLHAILDNQKKLLDAQQNTNSILKWIAFLTFALGVSLCVLEALYY